MPKIINAGALGAKWAQRTANAADAYKAGINAVTENPMDKAAAAADTWFQRVSAPETRDKFRNNLQGRNINDWKGPALGKGAANFVTGAREGQAKYQAYITDAAPFMQQAMDEINRMPKATFEDRQARARRWAEIMHTYQRKR